MSQNLFEELNKQSTGQGNAFGDANIDNLGVDEKEFSGAENDIFSDGFAFDFDDEEEPSKSEESAQRITAEVAARQYVVTFNMAMSRIASSYAKTSSPEKYKLSETEQKEYEEVTTAFFQSIQWQPDPKAMFIGTTAMFCFVIMAKAYEDRQAEKATSKFAKSSKKWKEAETDAERAEAAEERKEAMNQAGRAALRKQFKVDIDGFYTNYDNGDYCKKKDRVQKPSREIQMFLDRYRYNEDGSQRPWGDINADIRRELGISLNS